MGIVQRLISKTIYDSAIENAIKNLTYIKFIDFKKNVTVL